MYIDTSKTTIRGKTYSRCLLRESYRQDGKVKHRTIANLAKWSPELVQMLKAALAGKLLPADRVVTAESIGIHQGQAFGAVYVLARLAQRLKITKALGKSPFLLTVLWLIFARIIDQGSRLSAARLAKRHAVKEVLGLDNVSAHDLYRALDWLADNQEMIEKRLFRLRKDANKPQLFLYDVTSSYLEGQQNELADWGYNRDKKRGKKQIVIGLLTDEMGEPLAVRVFRGNTGDPSTCLDQIRLLAEAFGVAEVTLVGDRGMIKQTQIDALNAAQFHYITAITKSQIRSLLSTGVLQLDLFDEEITEVQDSDLRYILRRNPVRAREIVLAREGKYESLRDKVQHANSYLKEHVKASVEVQLRHLTAYAQKLNIDRWLQITANGRELRLIRDENALQEIALLDGCFVIKTDLPADVADAQTVHDRYKDLIQVENAFRTMKTECLEVRPVYVRKEKRTRGHVFVTMLAYKIVREIERCTPDRKDIPIGETISDLTQIMLVQVSDKEESIWRIPEPKKETVDLLNKLDVHLPPLIPTKGLQII